MNPMDQPSTRSFDLFKLMVAGLLVAVIAFLLMQGQDAGKPIAVVPTTSPLPVAVADTATPEPTPVPTIEAIAAPELAQPEIAADGSVKLSGRGQPGAMLDILANGASVGSTKVASDGAWLYTPQLAAGDYELVVNTVDAAGKVINQSAPLAITVPAPPVTPAMPQFTKPQIADDGNLTLSGAGEPKSTLDILANGVSLGTAVVADDGTWDFAAPLDPGDYDLIVRTLNADGSVANETLPVAITVPQPAAPAVAVAEIEQTTVNGGILLLAGKAQPDALLSVMVNGSRLGRATAANDGFDIDTELTDKVHILYYTKEA